MRCEARALVRSWTRLRVRFPGALPTPVFAGGDWTRFHLDLAGIRVETNRKRCPAAAALVDRLSESWILGSAGFYLLGPRSHVRPHTGLRAGFLRAHLGLICPDGCALRVGDETRAWRDGEVLVFDDGFEHEAWNPTGSTRCVFQIDFVPAERVARVPGDGMRVLRESVLHELARTRPAFLAAELGVADDLQDVLRDLRRRARAADGGRSLRAAAEQVELAGLFL